MKWNWGGKSYSYNIDDEDYLNLVRAVFFEGKPQNIILWTLLQRFAMLYSTGAYKNLSDFLKAYVQPINPKWFTNGALHQAYLKTLIEAGKNKEAEDEKRKAQVRVNKSKYPLGNFPVASISTVDNVLSGGIPRSPAPESVHYWASRASGNMSQTQAKEHNAKIKPNLTLLDVGVGWLPGVNVFFAAKDAGYPKNLNFKLPSSQSGSGLTKVGGLIAILATYFIYKILKG